MKEQNYLDWYVELSDATVSGDTLLEEKLTEEGNQSQITYNDLLRVSTAITEVSLNAIDLQNVLQEQKMDEIVSFLVEKEIMTLEDANELSDRLKDIDETLIKIRENLEEK